MKTKLTKRQLWAIWESEYKRSIKAGLSSEEAHQRADARLNEKRRAQTSDAPQPAEVE